MLIIADDKIPYLKGVLEEFAEVKYLPGPSIAPSDLEQADVLITRTRTLCNEALLKGSKIKLITSATIGYDHIDTVYCEKNMIAWCNAPGCNSASVNQYIAASLLYYAAEKKINLSDLTIGIVGVGNVGKKVARIAQILGMKTLLNDPPRETNEGPQDFVSLSRILKEADIITLHVPLNHDGPYQTKGMADEEFFRQTSRSPLFINTCRGEVMLTNAVKKALRQELIKDCIIDCWEHEPDIDCDFMNQCFLATSHIAGYSRDGKANGTAQVVQAIAKKFHLPLEKWYPAKIESPIIPNIWLDGTGKSSQELMAEAVISTYDIIEDSRRLKSSIKDFEKLRGAYPLRREFSAYTLHLQHVDELTTGALQDLGFRIYDS